MSKKTVEIILSSCQESDIIHSIKKPGRFCQRLVPFVCSWCLTRFSEAVSASNLTQFTKAFLRFISYLCCECCYGKRTDLKRRHSHTRHAVKLLQPVQRATWPNLQNKCHQSRFLQNHHDLYVATFRLFRLKFLFLFSQHCDSVLVMFEPKCHSVRVWIKTPSLVATSCKRWVQMSTLNLRLYC